jgi:hypothetical protein
MENAADSLVDDVAECHAEEKNMTEYTQDASKGDWEFKIVRSDSGAFRKPEVLEKLIDEEAQSGWVLLEKFDDNRVRFKRPRSAHTRDAYLDGIDPYRTQYGAPSAQYVTIAVLIGLLLLAMFGFLAFFLASAR